MGLIRLVRGAALAVCLVIRFFIRGIMKRFINRPSYLKVVLQGSQYRATCLSFHVCERVINFFGYRFAAVVLQVIFDVVDSETSQFSEEYILALNEFETLLRY